MAFASTTTPRHGLGHTLLSPVRHLVQTIEWIRECNRIGNEYEQMSHMSDSRLSDEFRFNALHYAAWYQPMCRRLV